jgi:hypothetical protein
VPGYAHFRGTGMTSSSAAGFSPQHSKRQDGKRGWQLLRFWRKYREKARFHPKKCDPENPLIMFLSPP